jgi:phenylalanyl-tRNA synthetase alpha chain
MRGLPTIRSISTTQHKQPRLESIALQGRFYPRDEWSNIPQKLLDKVGLELHNRPLHPLNILKLHIQQQFHRLSPSQQKLFPFPVVDSLSPVVSVQQNFDQLLIPSDHVSRSNSDTYYLNSQHLLRTHTSAHQVSMLQTERYRDAFLLTADVYRRDEIDPCHYPIFHQMEGVRVFDSSSSSAALSASPLNQELAIMMAQSPLHNTPLLLHSNSSALQSLQPCHTKDQVIQVAQHLQFSLESMVRSLFQQPNLQIRWVDAYFPFTSPSWELEIFYRDKWMEVCGCGIVRDEILKQANIHDSVGWAFGLGLERIAMCLFDIPDIRLFWSTDPRFLQQFTDNKIIQFRPFSKYPPSERDISFWLSSNFVDNHFYELVRDVAGDWVEDVRLVSPVIRRIILFVLPIPMYSYYLHSNRYT